MGFAIIDSAVVLQPKASSISLATAEGLSCAEEFQKALETRGVP
ncbi:MAG: hypothetical protein QXX83_10370 [Thermofilum sp.]